MRFCRYGENRLGVVSGETVRDVTGALAVLPSAGYPFPGHDVFIERLDEVRSAVERMPSEAGSPVSDVHLLSPLANPGKLIAAPVNYRAHLQEAIDDEATFTRAHVRPIHETGLFLKATSSLVGAGAAIELRHLDRRTDHEIELAVVIGKRCRGVRREDALGCVAGYTIGLDITVRGPEERSLRKSLDTYSVLGPVLVTADEIGDPAGLGLVLELDGAVKQQANTADLIMDVPALIAFASSFYTLHPGDVLLTGTPEGVGPIAPGQRITATIDRIGSMAIDVVAA